MPGPRRDLPPANACPLGEAFRRYGDAELVAAFDAAEAAYAQAAAIRPILPILVLGGVPDPAEERTRKAEAALVTAIKHLIEYGWARLRAGEWIAWAREGSPTAPWQRLPAEAWVVLRPPERRRELRHGGDVWADWIITAEGVPLRWYSAVVDPPVRRPPSRAALAAALEQAHAEKGGSLTQDEAEAIGRRLGASRKHARELHDSKWPKRRRSPRAARTHPKPLK